MEIANTSDRQLETLRLYGGLVEEREDWGGGLVLCCGAGSAASGTPTAVSIAGGATLVLEGDAVEVKAAMRRGEIDFVVNTLDEALRALKNEVRLHRPLSVGLIVDVDAALQEMVGRGVQPDLLMIGANQNAGAFLQDENIRAMQAGGMGLRRIGRLSNDRYEEVFLPAANAVELRALDEKVLTVLPNDDLVRSRWIQRVPKYLREARSGGRWAWLTEEERRQVCG